MVVNNHFIREGHLFPYRGKLSHHIQLHEKLYPNSIEQKYQYVPEVLNVHMNEIYKKLTTNKSNKLRFKKVFRKIPFSFSKVNFSLLEKKILLKKIDYFLFSFT